MNIIYGLTSIIYLSTIALLVFPFISPTQWLSWVFFAVGASLGGLLILFFPVNIYLALLLLLFIALSFTMLVLGIFHGSIWNIFKVDCDCTDPICDCHSHRKVCRSHKKTHDNRNKKRDHKRKVPKQSVCTSCTTHITKKRGGKKIHSDGDTKKTAKRGHKDWYNYDKDVQRNLDLRVHTNANNISLLKEDSVQDDTLESGYISGLSSSTSTSSFMSDDIILHTPKRKKAEKVVYVKKKDDKEEKEDDDIVEKNDITPDDDDDDLIVLESPNVKYNDTAEDDDGDNFPSD